jgi:hypothetical protein
VPTMPMHPPPTASRVFGSSPALQCGNMKPALLVSSAAIDDAFHVETANTANINIRMASALE